MFLWFKKYQQFILYSICLAVLILLIKWLEVRFLIIQPRLEVYAGAIAFIFTVLGIWLALKLNRPKVEMRVVEKEVYLGLDFVFNEAAFLQLGLSRRELDVLQLMADGLSNQEIADRLFVSLNTIKTHVSRLFEKLEVKRRTQAIEVAKKKGIIA